MKVLVACEFSGRVTSAFRAKGHEAWSCDLLDPDYHPSWHIKDDVLGWLDCGWDLMIAHPPCTFLTVSGLFRNKDNPERSQQTEASLDFVRTLLGAPIGRIALENPIGCISTRIRKPDQIIQPYEFGHDASKRTCLWLKNLPLLQKDSDRYVEPRMVNGRPRWANQTDSGQNRLGPSVDRWKLRSITYQGIADAMADQWGIF